MIKNVNKKSLSHISLFIGLLLGILPLRGHSQVDPSIDWKVMHLPHFDLIYDARHQELANIYADRLEDNRTVLGEYFLEQPDFTTVILNDRTDLTNGYATPLPYRHIMLFPVLPYPLETISEYGDWARELAMHEYTHILSFETRRGAVKWLRYVFGNIITPNIVLPRWWLEGIAVDMETRTSGKGRLRSAYQDASIRAYFSENQLDQVNLADIAETAIPTWPQGGRPYLFGSLLWSEMIGRYGQKIVWDLTYAYGGRFPWIIEGPVKDATGIGYSGLFFEMKSSLAKKSEAQLKVLKPQILVADAELKIKNAEEIFTPKISPDGLKMAVLVKNDANKRSVQILKRSSLDKPFDGTQKWGQISQDNNEFLPDSSPVPRKMQVGPDLRGIVERDEEDAPPGGTISRLEWSTDSKKFIYDLVDEYNGYYDYSDLHVYDLETEKTKRVTTAERAREAAFSPDGRYAVFVKLQAGSTALALWHVKEEKSQILYQPEIQTRISSPLFLSFNGNDGVIIFSMRKNGKENLYRFILPIANGAQPEQILSGFPEAHFPAMTPLGLTFISSLNGTQNLYLAGADLKSAKPLTQTGTFIGGGSYDPGLKEIYVSELTTRGFQVHRYPTSTLATLPSVTPMLGDRYPKKEKAVPSITKPAPEEYSPWSYLIPRYWFPTAYVTTEGVGIGGSTSSADPLAKHAYSLTALYDSGVDETSIAAIYANSTMKTTILASVLDYHTELINTPVRFRYQLDEISANWQLYPISTDLIAGIGWAYTSWDYERSTTTQQFLSKNQSGPTAYVSYSNISQSGAQISPEGGYSVRLHAVDYLKRNREQEEFQQYSVSADKYFSRWLPKHHVIMMRYQGQYIQKQGPDPVDPGNYAFTVPYNPFGNAGNSLFVMRGYRAGQFLGKTLSNVGLEYRFPVSNFYKGWGTVPAYIKRLHAAVIAEAATVDGFAYNTDTEKYQAVPSNHVFATTGVEAKLDVTLGYALPFTFVFGAYLAHDPRFREPNQQFAISIQ